MLPASPEVGGRHSSLKPSARDSGLTPARQPPYSPPWESKSAPGQVPRAALSPQGPGQGQGLSSVCSQRRPLAPGPRERAGCSRRDLAQRILHGQEGPGLSDHRRYAATAKWAARRHHWGLRALPDLNNVLDPSFKTTLLKSLGLRQACVKQVHSLSALRWGRRHGRSKPSYRQVRSSLPI